ncbi:hypothetical protein LRX75_23100 [Rhizobium sp. DKSPLA3]|uniref:Uncharacterized protein n=1 Tax=Rhizobium quercicola TaxID=2901226 RepID=A0A9X1NVM9_9HYPH|nr:hypothetical protein [Rhizobium quercicola]MCD7111917.1 hypothetical protein [Rhizobium quercicola]
MFAWREPEHTCVENAIYLLTCRHVAIRNADDFLLHGLEQPFKLKNQYRLPGTALDCALLPIPTPLWADNEHSAAAVQFDPFFAQKYEPYPNELYYFHGFAEENANYAFEVHETNPIGYTTEVNQGFPDEPHFFYLLWNPKEPRFTADMSEEAKQAIKK